MYVTALHHAVAWLAADRQPAGSLVVRFVAIRSTDQFVTIYRIATAHRAVVAENKLQTFFVPFGRAVARHFFAVLRSLVIAATKLFITSASLSAVVNAL